MLNRLMQIELNINFRTKWQLLGRGCLGCGAFSVQESLFCSVCWEFDLDPRRLKYDSHMRTPQGFPHFYLFRWRPGESDALSNLIVALKEHRLESTFDFYARYLLQRTWIEGSEIFVPAPSSHPSRKHAQNLAKALVRLTGLEMRDPLVHHDGAQQKDRTKAQRKTLQFLTNENLTWLKTARPPEPNQEPRIVFVDDVLTTGSTAMAAYRALGRPAKFAVLSLLYREPLAAPEGL